MWTNFKDMHSGGSRKEKWANIYIEAPEDEARVIFYNRFGHNPDRVTCTCCGSDYSYDESETLKIASAFERGLRSVKQIRVDDSEGNFVRWEPEYPYLEPDETPPEGYEVRFLAFKGHPNGMYVDEYVALDSVLVIREEEITSEDRTGEVPDQGYVWVD